MRSFWISSCWVMMTTSVVVIVVVVPVLAGLAGSMAPSPRSALWRQIREAEAEIAWRKRGIAGHYNDFEEIQEKWFQYLSERNARVDRDDGPGVAGLAEQVAWFEAQSVMFDRRTTWAERTIADIEQKLPALREALARTYIDDWNPVTLPVAMNSVEPRLLLGLREQSRAHRADASSQTESARIHPLDSQIRPTAHGTSGGSVPIRKRRRLDHDDDDGGLPHPALETPLPSAETQAPAAADLSSSKHVTSAASHAEDVKGTGGALHNNDDTQEIEPLLDNIRLTDAADPPVSDSEVVLSEHQFANDAVSEYEINRALRPHTKPIDSLDIIIRRIDRRRRDIANEVQTLDSELGEFREITAELPGIIRNQTCQSHKNYYEAWFDVRTKEHVRIVRASEQRIRELRRGLERDQTRVKKIVQLRGSVELNDETAESEDGSAGEPVPPAAGAV
ncbi:unnamed protein product (mitochondrion) [Plasmodiophora brassicae]|uniref:Uncharacterized protein n=1 Tax=Plasmodiophora brassicae TaxID=37360 RepID=A0A3P3Y547_PLABS|nr:unnamed protein product [Plasmodiophora brassicae]